MPLAQREIIPIEHQRIHDGKSFTVSHAITDLSLDIAAPKYYRLSVPLGVYPHLEIELALLNAGLIELSETPTLTGQGTVLSTFNRNRVSSNTPGLVVAFGPTISAQGTVLGFARINGSAHPVAAVGGAMSTRHEFILSPGKTYLIKISTVADNNQSWLTLNWYE